MFVFNGQPMQDPNMMLIQEAMDICKSRQGDEPCKDCPCIQGIQKEYGVLYCDTGREKNYDNV